MVKKKKVLYVFGGEKASGAEIVIERLMRYNTDFVEPHLIISPGRFTDKLLLAKPPYPITVVDRLRKLNRSSGGKLSFYFRAFTNYFFISATVFKYLHKHNIQTVHANTMVPASYLLPAIAWCKLAAPKTTFVWSDHDITYFARQDNVFAKMCVAMYNKTLVVSQAVQHKYGNDPKVEVLYNGLDTDHFKPNANARSLFRTKYAVEHEAIVLGIAATISPRKGQVQLIEAFKTLRPQFPHIILVLAGSFSEDTPEYTHQFEALTKPGITEGILYIGHADDMLQFYNGCDIIINNSSLQGSEPLGTTIYEAMACEKIVVASCTGGTPEIITDKEDGFLFTPDDTAALADVLRLVAANACQLQPVQKAARKKVLRRFSIADMAARYNQIIQTTQR